jgi:hypothetical protein
MRRHTIWDALFEFPYEMYQWVARALKPAPIIECAPRPGERYARQKP